MLMAVLDALIKKVALETHLIMRLNLVLVQQLDQQRQTSLQMSIYRGRSLVQPKSFEWFLSSDSYTQM